MKIAYFDCYSGISGDMTLGAFLDAGLELSTLSRELAKLGIKGYKLKATKVKRGALAGTKFDCEASSSPHSHRSLKDILALIERSSLKPRVKSIAKSIFENIGAAEAKVHGLGKKSDVWLHELGDIDSIIDIVGAAIAMDELSIDALYSSEINTGRSFADTKHGRIPTPGPATLELLKGATTKILDIEHELVTPTGAGILKTLAKSFGPMPPLKISAIGYGAGSKDVPEMPNMLRVVMGEMQGSFKEDRVAVIETNIDDMSPQNFENIFEKLFDKGALDVYITNIYMKRSRPAFKLTVLTQPSRLNDMASVIFSETTTFGLRFYEMNRLKLNKAFEKVRTRYGDVNVKLGTGPEGIFTASPEYRDCAKISRAKKVPLKKVYEEAKKLAKA